MGQPLPDFLLLHLLVSLYHPCRTSILPAPETHVLLYLLTRLSHRDRHHLIFTLNNQKPSVITFPFLSITVVHTKPRLISTPTRLRSALVVSSPTHFQNVCGIQWSQADQGKKRIRSSFSYSALCSDYPARHHASPQTSLLKGIMTSKALFIHASHLNGYPMLRILALTSVALQIYQQQTLHYFPLFYILYIHLKVMLAHIQMVYTFSAKQNTV